MANSLDNVIRIVQESFVDSLASNTDQFTKIGKVLDYEGGQAKLLATNAGGIATEVTSGTTSVSATDLTSGISSTTQQAWVLKHAVPWAQLNWSVSLAADVGAQLANAAAQNINKLAMDGLEGLFAAASHPMAGAGAGQVGVGKAFIDTGLAFLQTEVGAGTNDNLLTGALSESNLNAARSLLRNYKNQRGLPMNMGAPGSDMVLVVGPENEALAYELTNSALSGADMQANRNQGYAEVVVMPFAVDPSDWYLIDRSRSPIGIWLGEAPTVQVRESEDGVFAIMVAKFQASFYKKSYEYGIVGSNVP